MIEFTWRGFDWTVKRSNSGRFIYRETKHFGGPWYDVELTLANKSIDLTFRRNLRYAIEQIERDEANENRIPLE